MRRTHIVDVVFTLVLFCVFVASVLMVLLSGAGVYRGIAETMEKSYEERTCLQYIEAKLRHFSGEGNIALTDFGDSSALMLSQEIEGTVYSTYIYYHDGVIKELFAESSLEFSPQDGLDIIRAQGISFDWVSENLIRIDCTGESGGGAEIFFNVRGVESGGAA